MAFLSQRELEETLRPFQSAKWKLNNNWLSVTVGRRRQLLVRGTFYVLYSPDNLNTVILLYKKRDRLYVRISGRHTVDCTALTHKVYDLPYHLSSSYSGRSRRLTFPAVPLLCLHTLDFLHQLETLTFFVFNSIKKCYKNWLTKKL